MMEITKDIVQTTKNQIADEEHLFAASVLLSGKISKLAQLAYLCSGSLAGCW
jgi:hypothetical protein